MRKIEIVKEKQVQEEVLKLTKDEVLRILTDYGTYHLITNYDISEEFILENIEYFEKEILLLSPISFSEAFVNKALSIEFFTTDDISNLNVQTYKNLSGDFLKKYKPNINWSKVILYISTQCDDFEKYIDVISENNLWSLISSNDLPIDFINRWKDKLDWKQLSMVKSFTDEEINLFKDYIWQSSKYSEKSIVIDQIDEFDTDRFHDLILDYFANNGSNINTNK